MRRISNAGRRAETDANLERKRLWLSELAEKVNDGGSLAGEPYPTTMEAFREFEDLQRGLLKVRSPKTLDKKQSPHRTEYIEEVERYFAVLSTYKAVARKRPKKPSTQSQLDSSTQKVKDLRYLVGRLISQVAALMDENRKLRKSNRDTEKSKKLQSDTVKSLNKKVTELGGSLLKGVKGAPRDE
jgi:hypothetical protein